MLYDTLVIYRAATKYEIIRDDTVAPAKRGWYVREDNNGYIDLHGPYAQEADAQAKINELTNQ